ncbi:MAG: nicotinate-nucleotide--dimethylbenzimidazole phosphoribosyltransferase [Eubacteriales bacterium]|nr:nicotinate-nucleotide--dimethylbenzimidazole phosphoribosyltransferase [Eubacteriales bacterium]
MREELHLPEIRGLNQEAMEKCRENWNSIAIPLHSLGKMQDYLIQIAGIMETDKISIDKKGLLILCADNGIVEEGVTQSGQEVTALISENFLSDRATAAVLCKKAGADLFAVDIGIATDTRLIQRKISYGTKNFRKEPAMTREQAIRALQTGIDLVRERSEEGYRLLATGEMGIGNTTTSSALASIYLKMDPERMTGRGAGLTTAGLKKKVEVIREAIEKYESGFEDTIDMLCAVGGYDIAGMAGVFLGGAIYRIPVVIDGFISTVAAMTAARICPAAKEFMLVSHVSKEPAASLLLEAMGLEAPLHMDMCLGEGTGAVVLFPILDMACEVYYKMSTFDEIHLDAYQPLL